MKILALLLVLCFSVMAEEEKFDVEKLSKCEIEDLAKARKAVENAKAQLESTEAKVKRAHGDSGGAIGYVSAATLSCAPQLFTTVEIKGRFALKTTKGFSPCSGGGTLTLVSNGVTGDIETPITDGTNIIHSGR